MRFLGIVLATSLSSGCTLLFNPIEGGDGAGARDGAADAVTIDAAVINDAAVIPPDADSYEYPANILFLCTIFNSLKTEFGASDLDSDWESDEPITIENGELTLSTSNMLSVSAVNAQSAFPANVVSPSFDIRVGYLSDGATLTYRWHITNPESTIDAEITNESLRVIHGGMEVAQLQSPIFPLGLRIGISLDGTEKLEVAQWNALSEIWDSIEPDYVLTLANETQVRPLIILSAAAGRPATAKIVSFGAGCQ